MPGPYVAAEDIIPAGPRARYVLSIGDSRIAQGFGALGVVTDRKNVGINFWVDFLSRGRLESPGFLNFGVSGDTTTMVVARLPAIVAAAQTHRPAYARLLVSTNDRATASVMTAADSIANLDTIIQAMLDIGVPVALYAETPRQDATFNGGGLAYQTNGLVRHLAVRKWCLEQAKRPGVKVVDPWAVMSDQAVLANSQLGYTKAGYTHDGLHLPPSTSKMLAALELAAIDPSWMAADCRLLPQTSADVYAADHLFGSATSNPLFLGTAGSVPAGATGTIGSSWLGGTTIPSGITAVYSKQTVNGREIQQVVYSGTAPGTTVPTHNAMQQNVSYGTRGIVEGVTVEGGAEVKILAGQTGLAHVDIALSVGATSRLGGVSNASLSFPTDEMSGVLMTDPFTLPSGTGLVAALNVGFRGGQAVSATIQFTSFAVRQAE